MFPRSRNAFTLIELLIVVAIIGILAAIAIPNFLEAQVRAKYARCYADTKNISTAIETYRIDENEYPLTPLWPLDPCVHDPFTAPHETQWLRLIPLTTPTAYLTELPIDQFDDDNQSAKAKIFLMPGAANDPYNYQNLEHCEGSMVSGSPPPHPLYRSRYKIISPGLASNPEPIEWAVPYDPTNGTVSNGVCGFTNRGKIDGKIFNYENTWGIP